MSEEIPLEKFPKLMKHTQVKTESRTLPMVSRVDRKKVRYRSIVVKIAGIKRKREQSKNSQRKKYIQRRI